jgi:hypothetical protein
MGPKTGKTGRESTSDIKRLVISLSADHASFAHDALSLRSQVFDHPGLSRTRR